MSEDQGRYAGATHINRYGNERAHYQVLPAKKNGDRQIIGTDGTVIATVHGGRPAERVEEDARMMAFAGKLHWALGNSCAAFKCAAQDISVVATLIEKEPARVAELLKRIAVQLGERADAEGKAHEGALLVGDRAAAFDATWRQDGIPEPQFASPQVPEMPPLLHTGSAKTPTPRSR